MSKQDRVLIEINTNSIRKSLENLGLKDVSVARNANPFKVNIIDKGSSTIEKGIKTDIGGGSSKGKKSDNLQDDEDATNEIVKGFKQIEGLIQKGVDDQMNFQNSQNELIKGLKDELAETKKRIKKIEDTPMPKKSVVSNYMEKGFNDELNGGAKGVDKNIKGMLSISRQKKEICDLLRVKADFGDNNINLSKGLNNKEFTNALLTFQTSSVLPADILTKLKNEDKILIVK